VVQWNTGNVGKSSLQSIADNPALELVGATPGHRRRSAATPANWSALRRWA
jgi:hypothetical protein